MSFPNTDSEGFVTFPAFDPTLGTLTSATLNLGAIYTTTVTFFNAATAPTFGTIASSFFVTLFNVGYSVPLPTVAAPAPVNGVV